jgi:hypothetical protein
MSGGCTDCGRKGGCEDRKGGMMAAIGEALDRLYPTRRWAERDEASAFREGVPAGLGAVLADRLASALGTMTLYRPGGPEETCDFVYALCFGRRPSVLEVREGAALAEHLVEAGGEDAAGGEVSELHLRVALSTLAPFAAVQQVALAARWCREDLVCVEAPRAGVFDPLLLPRLQKLVAALAELDVRHLDFGDLTQPPPGFDAGNYASRYGVGGPALVNYLFFPQPPSAVTTTIIPLAPCASP